MTVETIPPPSRAASRETYHRGRATRWALFALALVAWRLLLRRPFRVEIRGGSMEPTLHDGEWAVAFRKPPLVGRVVVVEHPERPGFELVKRVAGAPGDAIGGRRLSAGEWWVEGDRAEASTDSRSFGPVPRSSIRGAVVLVYAPWSNRRML
ncbi:MAG: S26 family signal peptidase [Actinomycetota bacterium]